MPEKIEVVLLFERATKNTLRYVEDGTTPAVGVLYVQKPAAAKLGNPKVIKLTMETV